MKKPIRILIALIALIMFACDDSAMNTNTDEPVLAQSVVMSSSEDTLSSSSMSIERASVMEAIDSEVSSSSEQVPTVSEETPVNNTATSFLANLGTVRVSVNDGTTGKPSTKSTVSFSGEPGNSLKINFNANDTNADGREWDGGQTMVMVEYTISKPISLKNIDGLFAKSIYMDSVRHVDTTYFTRSEWNATTGSVSVQVPIINDMSKRPDPRYIGFIYTSSTGAIYDSRQRSEYQPDKYKESLFSDSDNDGWIYDLSSPYSNTPELCTETSCELTKVVFYFWTYCGKGSFIINGLSLLTK